MEAGLLRIGELSRRTGVSPELLRAWERRYGLLQPVRSQGGLRLYRPDDLDRVLRMQHHLAEGLAAAEAAVLATERKGASEDLAFDVEAARRDLGSALESFDESAAQGVLDSVISATTIDSMLSEIVLPYLHDLGERWERGEVSVAQEHFASAVLRGRLLGLARNWSRGLGPRALLACLPGEQHDLGLIAFGLALRSRGFRIAYLGGDMPIESVAGAADVIEPSAVVLSAVDPDGFQTFRRELRALASRHRSYIGGAGASEAEAKAIGATLLSGGPIEEADRLAEAAA
jgi:DNA-binding transcriptional MerR regulator/methylmalonyl-CoA mutase cobalamin-binding subunit